MVTTFAVATPHALIILTVSHDLLFRQPPSFAATLWPPFLLTELPSHRLPSHRMSLKRTARGRWPNASTIVAGVHYSELPADASAPTSRNLNNAALTIGSTAVL
jgi:hypothetical protein